MGQYSREELESAFQHYLRTVERAIETSDWELFVQAFTPDATYIEHMYGTFHGHDEIRAWITKTMGTFPGNEMTGFPTSWHVIDEDRGRIVCEIENHMPLLADGRVRQATNITILTYAGDNLFSCEEDVYNPAKFGELVTEWLRTGAETGELSEQAKLFAAHRSTRP
jgi:hypothetical protein